MSETEEDKQFDPTQKKLDDARKKGEIPRSTDLNTAATYAGFLVVAAAIGSESLLSLGEALSTMIENPEPLSNEMFSSHLQPVFGAILWNVVISIVPWFSIPGLLVILILLAQKSIIFAPEKLRPKLNRISLISNAKNKFGRNGLFEFGKSFVKLLIFSVILGRFLYLKMPEIAGSIYMAPMTIAALLMELCFVFMMIVFVVTIAIGSIDYFWQHAEHIRKHKMSRKEITDESKQQDGDPHIKQQRRQKGYDIAMNQMLADVPDADVIIVNPAHYAVALKWSRNAGAAPICVAKGVDEVAASIRRIAQESGIPIHRDPPTARSLFATVNIGDEISSQHYKAVAAAIRFADSIAKKSKAMR